MTGSKDTIAVHVNVNITTASLQAIVENAKRIVGRDNKGVYRVDTADMVSKMISRFLLENDFESFAKNIDYYSKSFIPCRTIFWSAVLLFATKNFLYTTNP